MTLTEKDNGRTVEAEGDEIEIVLGENPTTGFRWSVVDLDPSVRVVEDTYRLEEESGPGAGALHLIRLAFPGPGSYDVALRLWRDWEGEGSVLDRFEVTVEAGEAG
ncbi:MAG TPA: protease inhibitor I42 family protein [Acidimicrobiia bacterium]|nr:protease inhibitor I42 family protein [Acidimicrobiia bacterium]